MTGYESKRIFSMNLKAILDKNGISQIEFANKMNVAQSTVSSWCNGEKMPRMDKIERMAEFFGVTKASLIEESNESIIPFGYSPMPSRDVVPRVGRIACGNPITAEENVEGYDEVLSSWHADFTLVCVGDSMAPEIRDGDIVAIRSQPTVANGQIAAVRIGDEATLKKVFLQGDRLTLLPLNPMYAPLTYIGAEMENVRIEGKAVGLCRDL